MAKQSANEYWLHDNDESVEALAKHTSQAVDARKPGARQLANIAYGAARSSEGKHMGALFTALARAAAEWRMKDFNPQGLANTAWAFATVGHKDERLFSTLAAAAERRIRDFNCSSPTDDVFSGHLP